MTKSPTATASVTGIARTSCTDNGLNDGTTYYQMSTGGAWTGTVYVDSIDRSVP